MIGIFGLGDDCALRLTVAPGTYFQRAGAHSITASSTVVFMSKHELRRHVFIDRPIQGTLIKRVAMYWLCGAIMQVLLLAYLSIIAGAGTSNIHEKSSEFWTTLGVAALSSAVVLPLLMLDIVRLSHRWVGPIYRLRTAMQELASGESTQEISFRDGDFWQELAGHFNAIVRRMHALAAANHEPAHHEPAHHEPAHHEPSHTDETEAAIH